MSAEVLVVFRIRRRYHRTGWKPCRVGWRQNPKTVGLQGKMPAKEAE